MSGSTVRILLTARNSDPQAATCSRQCATKCAKHRHTSPGGCQSATNHIFGKNRHEQTKNKGLRVPLYDPDQQAWGRCLYWRQTTTAQQNGRKRRGGRQSRPRAQGGDPANSGFWGPSPAQPPPPPHPHGACPGCRRWVQGPPIEQETLQNEMDADIIWPRGVTVSTLDPESSDRGSNPREAFVAFF